jgi:DNA-binding response OmpR family regulator
MARLLLVDGSDLMGWLVAYLSPADVEIVRVRTFAEAERCLSERPPDAAIINLMPRNLDWRSLLDKCFDRRRAIPVLCCSAMENDEERDGPLPCRPRDFFTKSIPQEEFRELLEGLLAKSSAREKRHFTHREAQILASDDGKPGPSRA